MLWGTRQLDGCCAQRAGNAVPGREKKSFCGERKSLHIKNKSLRGANNSFHIKKKSLRRGKKSLHMKKKSLRHAKKSLNIKKKSLHDEKKSLRIKKKSLCGANAWGSRAARPRRRIMGGSPCTEANWG
jgi:peptidoglycan hydrolase CwlO-like protein